MSRSYVAFSSAPTTASQIHGDHSKDVQLASPPDDSISSLAWSSAANLLAVGSWDNKVRVYDATRSLTGTGRAIIDFDGPVLSCDWSKDGRKVVGAGADKTARILDLGANGASAQQIGAHDAPIRSVRFFQGPGNAAMVVTGSWDKTVRYWDLRTPSAIASITCDDKIYSMDVKDKLLVIATADKLFHSVDLNHPNTVFKVSESSCKHQTRVVCCLPDSSGFSMASIEGRCAIQKTVVKKPEATFTFKCHRSAMVNNSVDVYAVNAISFHPRTGAMSTAGADGAFNFWDLGSKSRLRSYSSVGGPITATAFNNNGNVFAYAVSYDWSKGYAGNTPQHVNKVMLHSVIEGDCEKKSSLTNRR